MDELFWKDIAAHDRQVAGGGVEIWIGSEPTFTKPRSTEPCWLGEALGSEKEVHALALLRSLSRRLPGSTQLLRVPGKSYPGEREPRWCFGTLFARYESSAGCRAEPAPLREGSSEAPIPETNQAWLTVTPDPGVVEINMAPAHDLASFARWAEAVYAAAADAGLSAVRYRYTGEITDSGGGGQLTLGGPTPARSPFFVRPQLLPGLIRYLNRHPSLSYRFAPAFCGSASQAPRTDEGVRERFEELPVALDYLAAQGDAATPAELGGMLGPLLVDSAGCAHRAELNVEKLWNPDLGARGVLGLAELRALRMPESAAGLAATAALFRAIAARLARAPYLEPIIDWGPALHERFALPLFLDADLEQVLSDLDAHGFGLGPRLCAELRRRPAPIVTLDNGAATLELRTGVSFWPLIGEAALVARSGARRVDSSTSRLQLTIRAPRGTSLGRVSVGGWTVPLQPVDDPGKLAIGSILYRAFVPRDGLHASIAAHDPLQLCWERNAVTVHARLHAWRPNGGVYPGLPRDDAEAAARRAERVVVSTGGPGEFRPSPLRGATLDLRRLRI